MAGEPSPPPNYHLKQTIGSPGAWGDRGFGSFALKDSRGVWVVGNAYPLRAQLAATWNCSSLKLSARKQKPGWCAEGDTRLDTKDRIIT